MVTIAGEAYDAVAVGGNTWLVHWYKSDKTVVEAELWSPAGVAWEPREAIQAAIERGSWA